MALVVVALFVFVVGWFEDWPWWLAWGLMSPFGVLLLVDDVTSDAVFGAPGEEDWLSGDGDFGGGDFGGGGGDGGGGE